MYACMYVYVGRDADHHGVNKTGLVTMMAICTFGYGHGGFGSTIMETCLENGQWPAAILLTGMQAHVLTNYGMETT